MDGDRFAPRDNRRGDVARAVFYVRAVYPDRLDGDALAWFEGQVETLLVWHAGDPADDTERQRSDAVARWQGTPNPFVLDATLAERAFGESPTPGVPRWRRSRPLRTGTAPVSSGRPSKKSASSSSSSTGRADAFGSAWARWGSVDAVGTPGAYPPDHPAPHRR